MLYLQLKTPVAREARARAELQRFAPYGASIHQRGESDFYDLLIPLDQRKAHRQAAWFERNWEGFFYLVEVQTFAGGVVSTPVLAPKSKKLVEPVQ